MSFAILKYLLNKAEEKGDSSLSGAILKTCKKADASTEKGCLSVVEYLTGNSHPDALSNAIRIAFQCKKNENPHCDKAIENGAALSIHEKSISDVVSLIGILSTRSGVQKHRPFAQQAIALFEPHLEELQKGVENCRQAHQDLQSDPDPTSWAPCYARASWSERLEGLNRGHSKWWKEDYASKKIEELSDELKSSLGDGKTLAQFCTLMSNSSSCQTFAERILQKLLISEQFEEAQQLMAKSGGTLTIQIAPILKQLEQKGKWDEAVSFLLSYHKVYPSMDLQQFAQELWNKIIGSSEPYKAASLLNLDVNLDIRKTLDHALQHHDDSHLHRIYLLAKSWIEKKDAKYDEPLKRIIRGFFAIGPSTSWYHLDKEEMARVLATNWAYAKDPQRVDALSLRSSYRLNQMRGSGFDRYSDQIDVVNWEQIVS